MLGPRLAYRLVYDVGEVALSHAVSVDGLHATETVHLAVTLAWRTELLHEVMRTLRSVVIARQPQVGVGVLLLGLKHDSVKVCHILHHSSVCVEHDDATRSVKEFVQEELECGGASTVVTRVIPIGREEGSSKSIKRRDIIHADECALVGQWSEQIDSVVALRVCVDDEVEVKSRRARGQDRSHARPRLLQLLLSSSRDVQHVNRVVTVRVTARQCDDRLLRDNR